MTRVSEPQMISRNMKKYPPAICALILINESRLPAGHHSSCSYVGFLPLDLCRNKHTRRLSYTCLLPIIFGVQILKRKEVLLFILTPSFASARDASNFELRADSVADGRTCASALGGRKSRQLNRVRTNPF